MTTLTQRAKQARTREEDPDRVERYADALIAKVGEVEGEHWFEFADQTERAGIFELARAAMKVADERRARRIGCLCGNPDLPGHCPGPANCTMHGEVAA